MKIRLSTFRKIVGTGTLHLALASGTFNTSLGQAVPQAQTVPSQPPQIPRQPTSFGLPQPVMAVPGGYGGSHAVQTPPEPTFNINFPGGSIETFIEVVSKARGSLLNVAIPEELTGMPIPAIRMDQVTAFTLLEAVSRASLKRVGVVQSNFGQGPQPTFEGIQFEGIHGGNAWVLKRIEPVVTQSPSQKSMMFFNLELYLSQFNISDIITVLQAAQKLDPEAKELSLKFHEETKLLMVRGTQNELILVQGALKELNQSIRPSPPTPPKPHPKALPSHPSPPFLPSSSSPDSKKAE